MKQKPKTKKIKKSKILKRALTVFLLFTFIFSLMNLNVTCYDISEFKNKQACVISTNKAEAFAPLLLWGAGAVASYFIADAVTGEDNLFVRGINWVLYAIFKFFALLLGIAGFLFDWAIDANNIRDVIHRQAIYDAWKMVRDFLNLGFILILLYSAFCTIFQIEKYHLKKILLMLVLMALLVNFSFPVSRFIVDASNVTMYYFLNSTFNQEETKSFSAGLAGDTGIADILVPRKSNGDFDSQGATSQILMAIFFVFCLMITMGVIAAIFVIRIVILAVLIIFSSVGFVAAVFPGTKTFATSWWTALFKYAFTGPILVFMMLIAYNLMREMATEGTKKSMEQYAQNYTHDPSLLANAAYFFIPIVILWAGIISTQKMGIMGADWLVGKATGARNWFAKIPVRAAVATGVPGGVKKAWDERKGIRIPKTQARLFSGKVERGKRTDEREAKIAGFASSGSSGWKAAGVRAKDKRVREKADENKKLGVSASQLEKDLGSNDEITRKASALNMAEQGLINNIDRFEKALQASGNDDDFKKKIIDKTPKEITRDIIKDGKSLNRVIEASVIKDGKNVDENKTKMIQEIIRGRVKADNNINILIEHDKNYGKYGKNSKKFGEITKSKKEIYSDHLEKLSAENLAKQKDLLDKQEFHDFFLLNKAPGGPDEDSNFITKVAEDMSMKDRLDWRKRGYKI